MSSILETFFILFQTDAKRVTSEIETADAAGAKLGETLDKVGSVDPTGVKEVDNALKEGGKSAAKLQNELDKTPPEAAKLKRELIDADRAAQKLGGSFVGMATKLGAVVGGLFSAGAIVNSIRSSFTAIDEMSRTASRFNINVEGYNAFNGVIEDLGGNAETSERFLRRFADSAATAFGDLDSTQAKAFKSLGVSLEDAQGNLKDTEQVLVEVASGLEKLDKQQQLARLRELGVVDPVMRQLLLSGSANVMAKFADERAKGVITNEQVKVVHDFVEAWNDVKDEVGAFFNSLAGNWAPQLTRWAEAIQKFFRYLRDHSDLVKGFAIGLSVALGVVAAVLWGSYIPAWTAAAVAVLAATWPIVAITAAVLAAAAAFALAWEDVQAFLKGQPSLLGDLVAKYEWVRQAVDLIGKAFKVAAAVGADVWDFLSRAAGEFFDFLQAAAPVVGDVFRVIGDVAVATFRGIWAVAGPILGLIVDAVLLWGRVQGTVLRAIWAVVQEVFGAIWPFVQPVLAAVVTGAQWLGSIFAQVAAAIWGQWGAMFGRFVERINFVVGLVRGLMGWIETARQGLDKLTPGGKGRAETAPAVAQGRAQVAGASRTPMAAQTPASMAARGPTTKSTNVTVGKVEVHTQATDADGMAKAAGGALSSQLRRTSAQHDDGVDR